MSEILLVFIPITLVCIFSCLYNQYINRNSEVDGSYVSYEENQENQDDDCPVELELDEMKIDDENALQREIEIEQKEKKDHDEGVI
jgi:hypothetical protein